jgi:hypothetical protein
MWCLLITGDTPVWVEKSYIVLARLKKQCSREEESWLNRINLRGEISFWVLKPWKSFLIFVSPEKEWKNFQSRPACVLVQVILTYEAIAAIAQGRVLSREPVKHFRWERGIMIIQWIPEIHSYRLQPNSKLSTLRTLLKWSQPPWNICVCVRRWNSCNLEWRNVDATRVLNRNARNMVASTSYWIRDVVRIVPDARFPCSTSAVL